MGYPRHEFPIPGWVILVGMVLVLVNAVGSSGLEASEIVLGFAAVFVVIAGVVWLYENHPRWVVFPMTISFVILILWSSYQSFVENGLEEFSGIICCIVWFGGFKLLDIFNKWSS